ncbi:endonuclease [Flavobacterium sp.]|uniref:endonuclease n=1 Tax=Flavobacterium sp. TaxID=239 RepID=UPI0037500354
MKQRLQLLTLLFSIYSFAQIPTGYYSTATGTSYTLKTQLYNKITGHTNNGYDGLWTTYSTSDRDNQYENDNSIIDIYSEKPTSVDPYKYTYGTSQCGTYSTEGNCYNREHIIPQSVFNTASPMVADAHFIPPTDGKVNGMRSNYPHGTVATASWTSLNGSKLGTSSVSGYTGTVFEPINEFKGDVARMYFYFATRYQNTVAGYSYAMFNGTSNQVFSTPFLNMLLAWNSQDPVSAREIARNNAIYVRQGNRNPFIDHPEYVNMIWGSGVPTSDTQAPTVPTNLVASSITSTSLNLSWTASTDNVGITGYDVYMNGVLRTTITSISTSITGLAGSTAYSFYVKAKDAAGNSSANSTTINATTLAPADTQAPTSPTGLTASGITTTSINLNWTASTDNVAVSGYDIYMNGSLRTSVTSTNTSITGLTAATTYSFYVKAKDAATNVSASSVTINSTTNSSAPSVTNLYFSEYLEGFSNNKALEITNVTGVSVNLSTYSIKKQTNGAGSWSTGIILSGTIANNAKYVIVNSLISSTCYSTTTANLSTTSTDMTFNGNDAIGLFKNGVLIDVIGDFNGGTANFSADETLRRKATATVPKATFNKTTDWDVFATDTCTGLGNKSGNTDEIKATINSNFNIYPNPSNGNFNIYFDNSNESYCVEIYSLIGEKVFDKKNTNAIESVSNLQKGIYLIKVSNGNESITKKIIIN